MKRKDYFNQKVHEERLNYAKVGKVLLKDEYGKTGPEIVEKQYQLLSAMETFERRFEYRSILKAFETSMNKKNRLILSGHDSKYKSNNSHGPNKLLLTKLKFKPIPKHRSSSAVKLFSQNLNIKNKNKINKTKKIGKNFSYNIFPLFKGKTFYKKNNNFPYLFDSPKNVNKNYQVRDKKVIRFPSNSDNADFTHSINLRMDIIKKHEKENRMKKILSKNLFGDNYNIKNNNKENNEEENEEIEKSPFKEIRNNFEYGKIMEDLKEKYLFYPYTYLEEHKNIDPDKFKFMIDNFNSKFSLFGKNKILNEKTRKYYKKLTFNNNLRPSVKIIEKIKKKKKKEKM